MLPKGKKMHPSGDAKRGVPGRKGGGGRSPKENGGKTIETGGFHHRASARMTPICKLENFLILGCSVSVKKKRWLGKIGDERNSPEGREGRGGGGEVRVRVSC